MILKMDNLVEKDDDVWSIVNTGVMRNSNGKVETFCHLASTTRFIKQRNGEYPRQVQDWVEGSIFPSDVQFVHFKKDNLFIKLDSEIWLERTMNSEWIPASDKDQKKYTKYYDSNDESLSLYRVFSVKDLEQEGNEFRKESEANFDQCAP